MPRNKKKTLNLIWVYILIFLLPILLFASEKLRFTRIFATGNTYYVATTGSDTNPGSFDSPLKTIAAGVSRVQPGDTLLVFGGTYYEKLIVTKNGTSTAPITIKTLENQRPIIDLQFRNSNNVDITGSFINVSGFELKNSSGYCANIKGQHNTLKNTIAHDCTDHGLYTDGQYIEIEGNTVYLSNLSNRARTTSSGWGSAIKVRVGGDHITIRNNRVYQNYGEGIAVTRGTNVLVQNNVAFDNFSVNIYVDNSHDVIVEKNFAYCTANSGFERNGNRPYGYAIGEEYYDGWGAQLANITIKNNISYNCYKGVAYFGADVPGGGLKNTLIAYNTLWGNTGTALSIAYSAAKQSGTIIANNIIEQSGGKLAWIESRSGIDMYNNFWVPSSPSSTTNAIGTGDKAGNVQFAISPSSDPSSFRLSSISPAKNSAKKIDSILDDFESKGRNTINDPYSDIGAIEYGTQPIASANPTPSLLPMPSALPTTSPTIKPTASASPTTFPTATPIYNSRPSFITNKLDRGNDGVYYSEEIKAYDEDETDTLTLKALNLPLGMELTSCSQYSSLSRKEIKCYLVGKLDYSANFFPTFIVEDNHGSVNSRNYKLMIK